jgi:restriction endonuclease S subunit
LKTLKNLQISIPSIEVQEEIINFIDDNNKNIINLNNQIDDIKLKSAALFYNIN